MTKVVSTTNDTMRNVATLSGMAWHTHGANACSTPIKSTENNTPRANA